MDSLIIIKFIFVILTVIIVIMCVREHLDMIDTSSLSSLSTLTPTTTPTVASISSNNVVTTASPLNQVYSPTYNLSQKATRLLYDNSCIYKLGKTDYRTYDADQNNIANYNPLIGYISQNLINDNCFN